MTSLVNGCLEIFGDFVVFVSKISFRKGWKVPTREEITQKLERLAGTQMSYEINKIKSIYDLLEYQGEQRGEQRGKQKGEQKGKQETLREMLEDCLTLRFPRIAQTTIKKILSIPDLDVLKSIFKVACTAESLDNFKRDIQGIAPVV